MDIKKIGQLFISAIEGTELTDQEIRFFEKYQIGGVILFSRNFSSLIQLKKLIQSIYGLKIDHPPLIMVDQEGGRVQRFKYPFSLFPSALWQAEHLTPKEIFQLHQHLACEMSHIGINTLLAPVCDIWTKEENKVIRDRAFGKDAKTVSANITAVVRSYKSMGILSCAKHFPGHGDTLLDSHFELPLEKKSMQDLEARELIPFKKAATSKVDMLMMSHILFPNAFSSISSLKNLPISLSLEAHQYVREHLKFDGIIISDDLQMKAITDQFSLIEAAHLALSHGSDLVEFQTFEGCREALVGVLDKISLEKDNYSQFMKKYQRIIQKKNQAFKNKNLEKIFLPIEMWTLEFEKITKLTQEFLKLYV